MSPEPNALKEAPTMNHPIHRLIPVLAVLAASTCFADEAQEQRERQAWQEVSGTAIHYFDVDVPGRNVITHQATPTETGVILRTTETIDIFGDLNGRALYHPETVIDETTGTLVNTGKQVFSGTILGEGPFLLLDEFFRFDVNLATGETRGTVLLIDPLDGSRVQCILWITGTGMTEEGNGLADYTGRCRFRGRTGGMFR
jgi:hypothetical protein